MSGKENGSLECSSSIHCSSLPPTPSPAARLPTCSVASSADHLHGFEGWLIEVRGLPIHHLDHHHPQRPDVHLWWGQGRRAELCGCGQRSGDTHRQVALLPSLPLILGPSLPDPMHSSLREPSEGFCPPCIHPLLFATLSPCPWIPLENLLLTTSVHGA